MTAAGQSASYPWVRSPNPLMCHGLSAYRVMTEPTLRRRNLGRILMSGMHRLARDDGAALRAHGWS